LVVAVASPDRSGVGHLLVPLALAGAFLGIPAARVWFLVRRGGPGRAVGLALALHVALAVLAASWFLGTNSDLFAIALPSVALLWALPIAGPARPSAQGRRRPSAQALTLASSAVLVVMLASWNAWTGVRGARGLAAGRRAAAETIAKRTPEGAYLLLSAVTAPRVAYLGLDASTGWGALVAAVHDGAARPGLLAVLRRHEGQRLFVSSAAFRLSPPQVAYLGTTEEDLWRALRDCCAPQPVASFHAGDDPETLYELARPAP